MHTPDPKGEVVVVAEVEKAREARVLMLEGFEHQNMDKDRKEVEKNGGKQVEQQQALASVDVVGKMRKVCFVLDTCFQEGDKC